MSGGARHALIVATDTYENDGLDQLRSPGQDALALAGVLGDSEVGGFDVDVVRNEPAHVVARRVEDFFADRARSDSLLLHFSCHGLKNASGQLFFAATDTLPERLSSTAVSADFVRRCMAEGRARNAVLFLDCCYGGAFMEGMGARGAADANVFDSFSARSFGSGRGWAVITASSAMEYAFEGTELAEDHHVRPSVFTRALAAGLASGEADLDADGRVSINELYDFLYDEVRRENPHQTPSRSIHLQGDVYLAHSKRCRIVGEGLPNDLKQAVSSPDSFSRRGVVPDLRRLLESSDPATAEAACRALQGLVRNDIKSIAVDAARALEEVSVRPSPGLVDFGRVVQHQRVPHQRIQLLGPMLAHDCVPHPREEWIHAVVEADTVDVSVDTERPGEREGALTLEGKAGQATVPVRVEVFAAPDPKSEGPRPSPPTLQGRMVGAPAAADAPAAAPQFAPAPLPHPASADAPVRHSVPQVPSPTPGPLTTPHGSRLVDLGVRLAARTIDYVLVFVFACVAAFSAVVFWAAVSGSDSSADVMANIMLGLFFLGWGVALFLYDWLFLRYGGATPGKMLLRIRVVDARGGGPLCHRQAAARAAFFGLPQTIPLLGNMLALFESLAARTDPWKRALHDRSAGTLVVHVVR
jgi:uncharacterized RDD family membrane protein YckC